ncbi:MAG: STAS domain-containing protein [Opitutales bacterium]|nr:STAS domain-containing protein [Opitutales bacterium]
MKHEISDRKLSIVVEDNILSTNVESLSTSFKELLNSSGDEFNQIILDLEGIDTIDSQGLNLLIGLFQECKNKKWGFRVTNCTENVKWLFSIFKLTEVFGVNQS